MKISKETLAIMKSFTVINNVFYLGVDVNAFSVVSSDNGFNGTYFDIPEKFEKYCMFQDASQLLSTIEAMGGEEAELEFEDQFVRITNKDGIHVKYLYSDELIIAKNNPRPKGYEKYSKPFDNTKEDYFKFEISREVLDKILKTSKILNLEQITFELKEGKGSVTIEKFVKEKKGLDTHKIDMEITGEGSGSVSINLDRFNILSGDYNVEARNGLVTKWINKNIKLIYNIAARS